MSAGALNRLVTIQQQSTVQDGIGQPVQTWTDVAAVWASVLHRSGIETIKADAETSVVKASIRIRRRTDVTAAMRVVHSDTTYQIKAVLPDERTREWVDLVCEVVR